MIDQLIQIVGHENLLTDEHSKQVFGRDWLKDYQPNPLCVVLPKSTSEVSRILALCNQNKIAVVPSGGRTGLSGGASACKQELVLSLSRMNKIIELDSIGYNITCEAGVITQTLQDYAEQQGLFFPIDFASKGSSHIGGNIATNAGGIRVIKYGNMRDWVLGLEVVTADGQILELNGKLNKNNSGYDLRNLIIGSEGTLAVITKATLKLTALPQQLVRVLCATNSLASILEIFTLARKKIKNLSAFEYFPGSGLAKVLTHHKITPPFPNEYTHYALIEVEQADTQELPKLEQLLAESLEKNVLDYVVISQNDKQLKELMNLRELLPDTLNQMHRVHKNDIAVPINSIANFITELEDTLKQTAQEFTAVIFGHIGDGNLHINLIKPDSLGEQAFVTRYQELDELIYKLVQKYRGTVSAEHGVGLIKKDYLHYTRSPLEMKLMREIKKVFDPNGILNPGKIF